MAQQKVSMKAMKFRRATAKHSASEWEWAEAE
jgi:hypothetical protein